MAAAEYNATVVQRIELAPGLIILGIAPDTLHPEFKAGQYVVLGLKASEPRIDEADPDQLAYRPADGEAPASGEAPGMSGCASLSPRYVVERSICRLLLPSYFSATASPVAPLPSIFGTIKAAMCL